MQFRIVETKQEDEESVYDEELSKEREKEPSVDTQITHRQSPSVLSQKSQKSERIDVVEIKPPKISQPAPSPPMSKVQSQKVKRSPTIDKTSFSKQPTKKINSPRDEKEPIKKQEKPSPVKKQSPKVNNIKKISSFSKVP